MPAEMRELILYVCCKCETAPAFGATKLNKVLFYSDFLAYARLGESITGEPYQKLDHGPAPKQLVPLRTEMIDKRELVVREKEYGVYTRKQPFALRPANLSGFSGKQIALVDYVIKCLWEKTAKQVSEMSHRFIGWELAELNEEIPYELSLVVAPEEYSDAESQWLESLLPLVRERMAA